MLNRFLWIGQKQGICRLFMSTKNNESLAGGDEGLGF